MTRLALFLLLAAGCHPTTTVGTANGVTVPKDSGSRCATICQDLGLGLDAVVVMASNVGCVCTLPPPAPPAAVPTARSSATSGGMAAILMQEEADEEARRRNSSSRRPSPPPKPYRSPTR